MYDSMLWYDRLRYRLMPYIYTTAADTWFNDGSIMRGLVSDFVADPKTWDIDDEYLFGHAFLVAPVTTFEARSRQVYLPAGADWYDFNSGAWHAGGRSEEHTSELQSLMRNSYAVFCLKKKIKKQMTKTT